MMKLGNIGLSQDEIQDLIELTPRQKRAWKKFEAAVRELKKAGVCFYHVLDSVSGLNGNNIEYITNREDVDGGHEDPGNLQYLTYPSVDITTSWADDTHIVIVTKKKKAMEG